MAFTFSLISMHSSLDICADSLASYFFPFRRASKTASRIFFTSAARKLKWRVNTYRGRKTRNSRFVLLRLHHVGVFNHLRTLHWDSFFFGHRFSNRSVVARRAVSTLANDWLALGGVNSVTSGVPLTTRGNANSIQGFEKTILPMTSGNTFVSTSGHVVGPRCVRARPITNISRAGEDPIGKSAKPRCSWVCSYCFTQVFL